MPNSGSLRSTRAGQRRQIYFAHAGDPRNEKEMTELETKSFPTGRRWEWAAVCLFFLSLFAFGAGGVIAVRAFAELQQVAASASQEKPTPETPRERELPNSLPNPS
jgi:hypothetical protein